MIEIISASLFLVSWFPESARWIFVTPIFAWLAKTSIFIRIWWHWLCGWLSRWLLIVIFVLLLIVDIIWIQSYLLLIIIIMLVYLHLSSQFRNWLYLFIGIVIIKFSLLILLFNSFHWCFNILVIQRSFNLFPNIRLYLQWRSNRITPVSER